MMLEVITRDELRYELANILYSNLLLQAKIIDAYNKIDGKPLSLEDYTNAVLKKLETNHYNQKEAIDAVNTTLHTYRK